MVTGKVSPVSLFWRTFLERCVDRPSLDEFDFLCRCELERETEERRRRLATTYTDAHDGHLCLAGRISRVVAR